MALNTYTELVAKIKIWMDNTETTFTATLDEVINMAELRVQRDLNLETFKANATGSLTQSQRELATPSDYIKPSSLTITVSSSYVHLYERTKEFCDMYAPAVATEDAPEFYAVDDVDNLYLVPTPDTTYAYTLRYLARIEALVSSTNETNWLTKNVWDLLFAACLYDASLLQDNAPEADKYLQKYVGLLVPALEQYRGEAEHRYGTLEPTPQVEARS